VNPIGSTAAEFVVYDRAGNLNREAATVATFGGAELVTA